MPQKNRRAKLAVIGMIFFTAYLVGCRTSRPVVEVGPELLKPSSTSQIKSTLGSAHLIISDLSFAEVSQTSDRLEVTISDQDFAEARIFLFDYQRGQKIPVIKGLIYLFRAEVWRQGRLISSTSFCPTSPSPVLAEGTKSLSLSLCSEDSVGREIP